jgi:5-methylcytosine-specific restriction protein A
MPFDPHLTKGQIVNNEQLMTIFKCSPQGGMRRSHTTNTLVIVSDHTKGLYGDRWDGNILHYTGMGLTGNQSITSTQNKTLAESDTNGISVFLFEVFESGQYFFQGQVVLAGKTYQEKQKDHEGNERMVWMFPLKLIDSQQPAAVNEEIVERVQEVKEKRAARLSNAELENLIKESPQKAGTREVASKDYDRNPYVAEYVKRRANGICELCHIPAPFMNKHKEPYLEEHHIVWLSKAGSDTIDNTVALCPNCHRRMHVLDHAEDRKLLSSKASKKP